MTTPQFDREARQGLAMVSPTLIFALLMLAAPLAAILAVSFMRDGYLEIIREFTFDNYRAVLTEPIYRQVMARSLGVATMVTLVTVILAFPVAYFVSFSVRPERKALWLFLITIPFWTAYLIRVFLWKVILGYEGVINASLTGLGVISEPLGFLLYNVNAIIITLAHAYAPFAILPIFVALERIDRSLLEAGRDLGETRLMTFWRVTLPLAMPGVLAAVLIVFIPTMGDYVTPELIGGGRIPMIAKLVQTQIMALDNKPLGAAIAVTAMLIVTILALIFLLLNRRFLRVKQ